MTRSDDLRNEAAALEARAAQLETPLTEDDVHKLWQDRQYQAITDARRDGRLNNLLGPTNQKEAS